MTCKHRSSVFHSHTTLAALNLSRLLIGLVLATLSTVALAQSGAATPDHQGGPGGAPQKAVHVPFTPGPYGPDGKVHQVAPVKAMSVPNETETPQIEEAKALAAAGLLTLTSKRPATVFSAEQLSLLQWNPGELNPAASSLLGSDSVKHAFHAAAEENKTAKPSSVLLRAPISPASARRDLFPLTAEWPPVHSKSWRWSMPVSTYMTKTEIY